MEAQSQQNNPGVPEEALVARCIQKPSANVMELVSPCVEAQYPLKPLVFIPPQASGLASVETSSWNDVAVQINSPRLMSKSSMQGTSQQSSFYVGSGGENERLGHFQYEDLAGIIGERGGSASDMSVISEKMYSGYGSSGEHYGGRVKFMCSFGGKILPRPGDGKLRYAGGDTRIVSIYRHSKYSDLMCKMQQLYGQPVLLKYQLPNEDLDALISVSCDEDVDNMMEEYDRLQSCDGSSKLRIFLFPPSEYDVGLVSEISDTRSTEKVYVDAVNGMPETQAVRSVVVMPTYSSSNVVSLEPSDTWSSQQGPIGISHVQPIVPPNSFVIAPAIGQPIPVGMIQANNVQHFPREFSSSPVNPSSPTVASNIRQPIIPDIPQNLYPDPFLKGLPAHMHGIQRSEVTYKDVESHVRCGTPSLTSQGDAPTWHPESRKLTDSPTRAHHETTGEHFFHPEQTVMPDPLMATGIPVGVMSQIDSHSRVPTVDSRKPQVSRMEIGVHPVNLSQVCDVQLPEVPQVSLQHGLEPRREDFQKVEQVQFRPIENVHIAAIPLQQQVSSQYYAPIATASNQAVGVSRPEIHPGCVPQKNPIQTAIYPPGPGLLDSGSAPSLPSLEIQENNPELKYIPHEGGQNRGHVDHTVAKIAVHSENDLPVRKLKPLNTRVDNREQVFSAEQTTIHQFPMAVVEKPNNHEGMYVQDYLTEGLQQPRTPPYVGGSPYRESLSPFVDNKAHRQMQLEDAAAIPPNLSPFADSKTVRDDQLVQPQCKDVVSMCCESVDWGMKQQLNEDMGWSNLNQLKKLEKSNTDINLIKLTNGSPLPTCDSSFINPSTISIGQVNAQAAFNTSTMLTSIAENLANIEGAKTLGLAQSPRLSGAPLTNPLSITSTESSNSLFIAKLEEGQWFKGMEADAQMKNDPGKNLSIETFGISGNPFSTDSLSGHHSEDKNYLQQGSLGLHANLNVIVNNEQTFDSQMQPTTSKTTFSPVEVSDLQASWLLSRESGGKVERENPSYESTSSNLLSEGLSYFNNDIMPSVQNKEWCAAIRSSETSEFPNLRSEPSIISTITEGKKKFSILDSGPVQNNTEATIASSLLFSEPTLSIQNWKESLATVRLEEQEQTEILFDNEKKDEVTFQSLVVKVSEMKVDDDSADTNADKSNAHLHPAAAAEAEAISRGLQTIKNADLEELRELGTGNFGTVYHGKWRGTDVAIKRIKSSCFTGRPSERDRLIADFWNEAYVLGQLHHPNVVAFYGVVPDGPDGTLATVTEFMVNGSLKQVLQKKDRTIDRRKRLLIIMDAAFGMEYLHGKNIIHFDFKCENLLVNMKDPQRPICKVGDLGLSKVKRQTMVSGGVRGTLPWMAPELLNGCSSFVTEKVDVFSFGVVMWELLTGEEPYADMHYGAIIGGIVNNTLRPAIPSWCEPAWKSLMERCWSTDPSARPSFVEIAAELRAMANSKP